MAASRRILKTTRHLLKVKIKTMETQRPLDLPRDSSQPDSISTRPHRCFTAPSLQLSIITDQSLYTQASFARDNPKRNPSSQSPSLHFHFPIECRKPHKIPIVPDLIAGLRNPTLASPRSHSHLQGRQRRHSPSRAPESCERRPGPLGAAVPG